jgi:hypothetical protein
MYGSVRRRRLTIPAIPARCILQPLRPDLVVSAPYLRLSLDTA